MYIYVYTYISTWMVIYTCRLPLWETCREISLQKALSPFVSFDRNYRQWSCVRCKKEKVLAQNRVTRSFVAGSLEHSLCLDSWFRSFWTQNPDPCIQDVTFQDPRKVGKTSVTFLRRVFEPKEEPG